LAILGHNPLHVVKHGIALEHSGELHPNDDLDAIRRVLAADVESFRRLVERYQRPLLTLIRNLTSPDTDHEGVDQEVFLAAFRSLASFDPKRSAFSTWL
jgi:RNA polymerase sigma-70 factor, ECF subfamily